MLGFLCKYLSVDRRQCLATVLLVGMSCPSSIQGVGSSTNLTFIFHRAITCFLSMSWLEIGPFMLHPKSVLVANGSHVAHFLISKGINVSAQSCPIRMLTSPSDFISARGNLHKCEYVSTWKQTLFTGI